MSIFRTRAAAAIATVGIVVPLGVGVVAASVNHDGPPGSWGPALESYCENNDYEGAADAGYLVIVLSNVGDTYTGTSADEAIFARGGNDTISGGGGDDLLCLSYGHDNGRGNRGNDAIFGEEHDDVLHGNRGDDYVNGGPQNDTCFGGGGTNVLISC